MQWFRFGRRTLAVFVAAAVLGVQSPWLTGVFAVDADDIPVITVDAYTQRGEISPYTLGSNHRHAYGGFGMYDEENDQVYPDFLEKTKEANLGVVRYPGGTIANLFTWKDTIGPREERSNVVLGNNYESVFPYYGLDEHMRYTEEIGAKVLYMVGEAAETPQDAADLVEYMNAPNDGSNPGGGIDWAAVRAENGHPEPYDVEYYEIGNEMYVDSQMYWLSLPSVNGENDRAKRYALGDTVQATGSPARAKGTWTDNVSGGEAGETFYTQYKPVVEGSETVYVDGEAWTRADSLDTAGAADKVYTIDYASGQITFGDGETGSIPPEGAAVTVDYQHKHAGFVEYYEAMKAIDPDIKIFSCLPFVYSSLSSDQCDGIVYHNYISASSELTTPQEVHDEFMDISDRLVQMIDSNVADLRNKSGSNDTIAAVTEFGTINVPHAYSADTSEVGRDEARNLSRALSFAVTFFGSAKAESLIHIHQGFTAFSFGGGPGLPNAGYVYNSLYAPYPDDPTQFVESGTARAYKVIGDNIGDTVRNSYIENNPATGEYKTYEALQVLATQADENGDLYLLAVNRDAENDITAAVNLLGYTISGPARIQTLNGADITACNTPENPDAISISETDASLGVGGGSFSYTFPAHSLVAIKLTGTSANLYTQNFALRHFNTPAIGSIPNYFQVERGTASIQNAREESGNKAFQITRQGSNTRVRASLSGQNMPVASPTTYDGILKITFLFKALQTSGARLDISVWGGDTEAFNLAFEGGKVKNNNATRAVYEKGKFYPVEMVVDHKAGEYVFYFDGRYIGSQSVYNAGVESPLDYLIFDAELQDGSFLIDDFQIFRMDNTLTSQITQADDVRQTVQVGTAPVLPDTVTVRYNTGETEERTVKWDAIDPADYAEAGSFTLSGAIDGLELTARAVIRVVKAVESIAPVELSTLAGYAPSLPREVMVTFADGEQVAKRVTWDELDPEQYQQPGIFTLTGTVEDTLERAAAQITVIERAGAPVITIDAYTLRQEESALLPGQRLNALVGACGLQAEAARGEDGALYLQVTNPTDGDLSATVNLTGYRITDDTVIRTADLPAEGDIPNLWSGEDATETTETLGVGGSSFAYDFPAGMTVSMKLTGTVNAVPPWMESFPLRHFSAISPGGFPNYFSLLEGAASVQNDPEQSGQRVVLFTSDVADTQVQATLSGQDLPAENPAGYNGLLKITFKLKSAPHGGTFQLQVMSGEKACITLAFDQNDILCGGEKQGEYLDNQWYDMEILLDHLAGGYAVYADGGCLLYQGAYDPGENPLDYILFSLSGRNGAFYLDDFHAEQADSAITPAITQVETVSITTTVGAAPVLPQQVLARYNTCETEPRAVAWEDIDPEKYAAAGVFTVTGAVDGLDIPARAAVTVINQVTSAQSVEVSTTAGTAPQLPASVSVTFTDGTTGEAGVIWEDVDESLYAEPGAFTVKGVVAGTEIQVTATVTVTAAPPIQAEITELAPAAVLTLTGRAPALPETIEATYSDGTKAQVPVVWEEIPADRYAAPGVFTIEGTVADTSLKATAEIRVFLSGDLDGDGEVTIADVMEACKVMARESAGTDPGNLEIYVGDLDGDHEITIADVMEICKILARGA